MANSGGSDGRRHRSLEGGIREWLGISIDIHHEKLSISSAVSSKLTGAQLRAARGMLNWSVKQLAQRTGISSAVIRRLEEYNGVPPMPEEAMLILRSTSHPLKDARRIAFMLFSDEGKKC